MSAEATNLWDCGDCGTRAIAAGLGFCPNCRKERQMPAVNRAGQSTVYGVPNEAQRAAMNHPVGISPPKPDDSEEVTTATTSIDEEAKVQAAQELVDAGFDPEDVGAAVGLPDTSQLDVTGARMADPETPQDPTPATDSTALATEKASQAKEAFSSGDKTGAVALLDEAIALDPTRADKWTKLKDQVLGSGEQW